jgi:hypothetical protein
VLDVDSEQLVGVTLDELATVLGGPVGGVSSMDTVVVQRGAQVLEVTFGSGRRCRVVVVSGPGGTTPSAIHLAEVDGPAGGHAGRSDA